VRVVHVLGPRDHFESIKDVWEIFRLFGGAEAREMIDARCLRKCVQELKASPQGMRIRRALTNMLEFLTAIRLFEKFCGCRRGAEGRGEYEVKVITLLVRRRRAG